jgi:hypothetical protein
MTIGELLVASAIVVTVAGGVAAVALPAHRSFVIEQEVADLEQRLRVAIDALAGDLRNARMVWPYRVGAVGHDPASSTFFRPDTVSVLVPSGTGVYVTRTYYVQADSGVAQLARYDGGSGDFPMVAEIGSLTFEYFADGAVSPLTLTDGPWYPDAASPDRFDVDLLGVRRVRVRVRMQAPAAFRGPAGPLFARSGTATPASPTIPDRRVQFDVALRNTDARR